MNFVDLLNTKDILKNVDNQVLVAFDVHSMEVNGDQKLLVPTFFKIFHTHLQQHKGE